MTHAPRPDPGPGLRGHRVLVLASQTPAIRRAAQAVAAEDDAPRYPGARVPGQRDWEQSQRRRRR